MTLAATLAYSADGLGSPRLAALIGVGTAVCGNTAIIAIAPVIEAKEEDISFAVATITLFGYTGGDRLPDDRARRSACRLDFGLWAGPRSTIRHRWWRPAPRFSDVVPEDATMVKLTRNTLMAPLHRADRLDLRAGAESERRRYCSPSTSARSTLVRHRVPDDDAVSDCGGGLGSCNVTVDSPGRGWVGRSALAERWRHEL